MTRNILSEDLADAIVTTARTATGDSLRSVTYFTRANFEQLYLRDDLEQDADLNDFVGHEWQGYKQTRNAYQDPSWATIASPCARSPTATSCGRRPNAGRAHHHGRPDDAVLRGNRRGHRTPAPRGVGQGVTTESAGDQRVMPVPANPRA